MKNSNTDRGTALQLTKINFSRAININVDFKSRKSDISKQEVECNLEFLMAFFWRQHSFKCKKLEWKPQELKRTTYLTTYEILTAFCGGSEKKLTWTW